MLRLSPGDSTKRRLCATRVGECSYSVPKAGAGCVGIEPSVHCPTADDASETLISIVGDKEFRVKFGIVSVLIECLWPENVTVWLTELCAIGGVLAVAH